jgi:hypothetical protein
VFPLVPLPASAFLSHSNPASVRANEVLDSLTVPDYGHSHPARSNWGSSSCSIPKNTLQRKEFPSRNTNSQHLDRLSACLIATKPQRYWAFIRRRFNAWLVREKFPAFKSAICGVSGLPL